MHRSEITIDLGAARRNVKRLIAALDGADLWVVVKADGYGHGAVDVAAAALGAGARVLCVVTLAEGLEMRAEYPTARILVMGPLVPGEVARARDAGLEIAVADADIPEDVRVHIKLDTGMGRFGLSELLSPPGRNVVGLMSHLATADRDLDFARAQVERFRELTEPHSQLTRHIASSAAVLRLPESHFDAARCGIAVYGLSPFGEDPAGDGLEPVLRWESRLAQVKLLQPGESTGYGRRFIADKPTWIGLVPVGYADGFRRDMTGTEVLVDGERRPVVGTISMDSFAVKLERELLVGTPVVIVGDGLLVEEHARVADTINYEISCGICSDRRRARRVIVDA
ncbi:MAG: alanine racemase [Gaiellaceae bacterium]|jgi:alanine racemase